ncbi:nicotinamide mononucleotide transporter [Endozoicomonas sp. G2_1]|uniref:nicotinamide riboside transporter PnuC n=1 Tax=Endozoicomonas sp. G2_1 TaxID=2821091 RepID=UPI001ADCCA0E|nr:nicotinamide riboside transporter PnuC [Endozoicomonas sp. G2_1]MBO9490638.1 nicotinamide mononucleotide transporter [Endozoicomonas sp. G2_1]
MTETINYFTNMAILEWIAVLTGLSYTVLAARGNIWCWPAALVSTVLYTYIFYDFYLWMDSLLQVYYFAMAIYGWLCWRNRQEISVNEEIVIKSWHWHKHSLVIGGLAVISLVVGWLMASFTPAHFPYMDAATTVFSVFATYLIAQKVLENWLYWLVIDAVSIYIYLEKGLQPTAFLFALYTMIVCFGYWHWLTLAKRQSETPSQLVLD